MPCEYVSTPPRHPNEYSQPSTLHIRRIQHVW
ncbi:hypothetical protein [Bacteriophage sp.]|nr:hypothetical protein [Bacteriophage sp.]